ncbi:MAG: hypothetical protein H0T61_11125 [Actinobacteria bacterium]|nr:hypothetical protein [Actinomycetota bacterium]
MNITVYLPDEIGERAKAAELPVSRLLRDAVVNELERRAAVTKALALSEVHELQLEDKDGRAYIGRVAGAILALESQGAKHVEVYLTDDERVILYDGNKRSYFVVEDPVEELRGYLTLDSYIDILDSLGETPIIEV